MVLAIFKEFSAIKCSVITKHSGVIKSLVIEQDIIFRTHDRDFSTLQQIWVQVMALSLCECYRFLPN